MAKEQIHVGLEIGTNKICVVVAETRGDGPLHILGVGEAPSRGVRKGEIVDFSTASKCVHEAVCDAEEKSDVDIDRVWVAVTGSHIQSFNNRGAVQVPAAKAEIDEDDLGDVELSAKEVNLPAEHIVLHTIIRHYYVDGKEGVLDPIGMIGRKLEADFHIVHGVRTRIENTIRCVMEAEVQVVDFVLNSLASSQVVLDQHQKDMGVAVLDIGGGVTDYIVYVDGAVRHSGVLAVGGDHITSDIVHGLRIPLSRAEKLKEAEASCDLDGFPPGDTIILKNDTSFSGCEVERRVLNTIVHLRMAELFSLLKQDIEAACQHPLDILGAGIVITGGCAHLRGIERLATETFGVPVRCTSARDVTGPTSSFENPQYSTAIGLVKYAHVMQADKEEAGSLLGSIGKLFKGRFRMF